MNKIFVSGNNIAYVPLPQPHKTKDKKRGTFRCYF